MIVSMKKLSRLFTLGLAQSFLICLTLSCWPYIEPPVIIFYLMFIFCVAIVRATIPNKNVRLPQKFKQTQALALLSSTTLMFTCFILFKTEYKEPFYIIISIITTTALNILLTLSHIASIDNEEKTLFSYTKKTIKYTWIIISLVAYHIARAKASIILDIPFDSTNKRPITFFFAFVYIFWVYYTLYHFLFIFIFFSPDLIKFSRNKETEPYPSLGYQISVILPSLLMYIALSNILNINMTNILNTGLNFTLRYDARDSFFCHNRYMFLTKHPDARFMLISEGSYRALIPYKDDINIFRLTCSDKEPFYSLNGVVDKNSLILITIKERANILINDLYLK